MANEEKTAEIAARIGASIRKSDDRKAAILAKRETIRHQIVVAAREAVTAHQTESIPHIPKAQEQIDTTIRPWWEQVISSGVFDQVLSWGRQRRIRQIPVSSSTRFLAPHNQYLILKYEQNPFKSEADRLVEDPDFELSEEELRRLSGRGARWSVFFSIGERRTFKSEIIDTGLYAIYESGRGEWGDGDTIPFQPTPSSDIFQYIPPVCVTSFAEEIRNGKVWTNLEKFLERR